jgi:tRNA threonylcarbamoyladenosine biosynthesis protein TsaB
MYSILLDSSSASLSVGLSQDHVLVDEVSYEAWQKQSELMVPEIDKLLRKHGLTRSDIKSVVASKGPGSYTGVRISLTIAKTISFALKIPLYLASSLEMMEVGAKATICLVNARSKRSYIGVYEGAKCLLADQIMDNEKAIAYVQKHPEYALSGELVYLGLKGEAVDVLKNLSEADTKKNLIENPLAAKPVYLKDSYPI